MNHAKNISKNFVRRNGFERNLQYIMREKILDAECEERYVRNNFLKSKKNYYECVRKNTIVDILFNRMMRHEIENVWNEGKAKNRKKVEFLCNKWKSDFENENVDTRGVQYKDIELGVELCDKNEEVIKYSRF